LIGIVITYLLDWLGVEVPRLPILPPDMNETAYGFIRVMLPGVAALLVYVALVAGARHARICRTVGWLPDIAAVLIALLLGVLAW